MKMFKLKSAITEDDSSDDAFFGNFFLDRRSVKNGVIVTDDIFAAPKIIDGNYDTNAISLKTLKGVPIHVDGSFNCTASHLTSLEHGPNYVRDVYDCSVNKLTDLKGAPQNPVASLIVNHNKKLVTLEGVTPKVQLLSVKSCPQLKSLHDIHKQMSAISRRFICHDFAMQITSSILGLMMIELGDISTEYNNDDVASILNKWKNQGRKGVLGAQRELLDLGYDELARL